MSPDAVEVVVYLGLGLALVIAALPDLLAWAAQ